LLTICDHGFYAHLSGSVKEPNISIYFFFPPITQWCSISNILFTGGRGVSDFSVLKYYPKPITCCLVLPPEIIMHDAYIGGRFWWVKILKLVTWQKICNYIELFGSSTRDRYARCIYQQMFRE